MTLPTRRHGNWDDRQIVHPVIFCNSRLILENMWTIKLTGNMAQGEKGVRGPPCKGRGIHLTGMKGYRGMALKGAAHQVGTVQALGGHLEIMVLGQGMRWPSGSNVSH